MTLEDAISRYGPIVDGVWENESKWCSVMQVSPYIGQYWINTASGLPVTKIYCNKDFQNPLENAFVMIKANGLLGELKTFDGCFGIRDVRGQPGTPSAHSYGIAIDINAATNPLGGPSTLSDELVKCFKLNRFTWGADFTRCDPMHMTLGW